MKNTAYILIVTLFISFNSKANNCADIFNTNVDVNLSLGISAVPGTINIEIDENAESISPSVLKFFSDTVEYSKLEKKLEKINWWRSKNGKKERATILARKKLIADLNHFLALGREGVSGAISLLTDPKKFPGLGLFYEVEKAYRVIESVAAHNLKKIELNKQQFEEFVYAQELLGELGFDYISIRKFLEKASGPGSRTQGNYLFSTSYREAAFMVLNSLGYGPQPDLEFGSRVSSHALKARRPPLALIELAIMSSPVALNAKMNRDLLGERLTALRSFFYEIVRNGFEVTYGKIYNFILSKVPVVKIPFQTLMKAINDARTRRIDLLTINSIISSGASNTEKLDDLRAKFAAEPKGTLLISFARVFDTEKKVRSTWDDLFKEAEYQSYKTKSELNDYFYDQMREAQRTALEPEFGEISEYEPPTAISKLATWVVMGAASATGLYYHFGASDWPMWSTIDTVFRFVTFN